MIKRVLFLAIVLFIASTSAHAQDYPKFEFWGTYSLLLPDIDVLDNDSLHGYGLGVQGNFSKSFGIAAEWTHNSKSSGPVTLFPGPPSVIFIPEIDTRVNYYLIGPRVSYRGGAVTAFGHALFGGASLKIEDEDVTGFSDTNNEFAMAIGGGIDINLGSRFAIRAAQFDYAPIHTDFNQRVTINGNVVSTSSWLHNTRFQAGVVVKF